MAKYYKKIFENWQECTREEYDQLPEDERKIVTNIYSIFSIVKFYKLTSVENPCEQPILSSNGVWGGDSFAVDSPSYVNGYYPFYAFDGSTTGTAVAINGTNPYKMYFPTPVNISNIKSVGYHDSSWLLNSYRIAYSDDDITYTNATEILTATNYTINANINKAIGYHKYWEIVPITCSSAGWSVRELYVHAHELSYTWTECTKEEYNQLPDNLRKQERGLYASKSNNKAYLGSRVALMHKVIKDVPWEQPYLTSNGTYGVDELATVTINTNYDTGAFRPFGSGEVTYRSWDNVMYWRFSTKKAIKITKFTINTSCSSGTLYGSKTNADGSWVTLGTWSGTGGHDNVTPAAINNITVDDYFNYFQIAGVSATYAAGYGYFNHFNTARVTATYKTEVLVLQ